LAFLRARRIQQTDEGTAVDSRLIQQTDEGAAADSRYTATATIHIVLDILLLLAHSVTALYCPLTFETLNHALHRSLTLHTTHHAVLLYPH
jgi:hypothetical protein